MPLQADVRSQAEPTTSESQPTNPAKACTESIQAHLPPKPRDIKIVWHHHLSRADEYIPFATYCNNQNDRQQFISAARTSLVHASPTPPWYPFATLADFEVSELALSSQMNAHQTEALIDIIQRVKADTTCQATASTDHSLLRRNCACECANHPIVDPDAQLPSAAPDPLDNSRRSTTSLPPSTMRQVLDKYQEWDRHRDGFTLQNLDDWNSFWSAAVFMTTDLKVR